MARLKIRAKDILKNREIRTLIVGTVSNWSNEEIKTLVQVVNDPDAYGCPEEIAQQLASKLQQRGV